MTTPEVKAILAGLPDLSGAPNYVEAESAYVVEGPGGVKFFGNEVFDEIYNPDEGRNEPVARYWKFHAQTKEFKGGPWILTQPQFDRLAPHLEVSNG